MERCMQRMKIIEAIKNVEDWYTLDQIEKLIENEPQTLTQYVEERLNKYSKNKHDNTYCTKSMNNMLQYEIKKIWQNVCTKLYAPEYIEHWSELLIKETKYTEGIDIWIMERGYMFNTAILAEAIFNIWCGKIRL